MKLLFTVRVDHLADKKTTGRSHELVADRIMKSKTTKEEDLGQSICIRSDATGFWAFMLDFVTKS